MSERADFFVGALDANLASGVNLLDSLLNAADSYYGMYVAEPPADKRPVEEPPAEERPVEEPVASLSHPGLPRYKRKACSFVAGRISCVDAYSGGVDVYFDDVPGYFVALSLDDLDRSGIKLTIGDYLVRMDDGKDFCIPKDIVESEFVRDH